MYDVDNFQQFYWPWLSKGCVILSYLVNLVLKNNIVPHKKCMKEIEHQI